MFAVLPTIMDLSSCCRPSQTSPAIRPPISSPPALIPLEKIESELIKSEGVEDFPLQDETNIQQGSALTSNVRVKVEHDQVNWQQNGETSKDDEGVKEMPTGNNDQNLYASTMTSHATPSAFPAIEPNLTIPQNISLQQLTALSQQMFATMLSLQRLQQSNAAATLGNLLPPPPDLGTVRGNAPQNIAHTPNSSSTIQRLSVASTSAQSHYSQSLSSSSPNSHENDLPLDLSKPATAKTSSQINSPSSSATKRQYDANSIASIRSNFPTLLANKAANIKKRKSPPPLVSSLPSTSSSLSHSSVTPWVSRHTSSESNNQMVNSQMQLHNWLLAAMSVQRMQQIALGQPTFFQDPQPNQDLSQGTAKRRKMDQTHQISNESRKINQTENGVMSHPTKTRKSPTFQQVHGSGRTSESPTAKSSNISPNSDHSQPGKRYRRYAKPPYSYVSLITLAILSSREKKLRLSQILKRISEMFPFFNGTYQGWRDSVRHNLSQNECFVKVLKNPYRPTAKGNFWTVNLNSIPHELLLRQNTLVSRYAQDSGYRYRKDLTEVFNLRTGVLRVPVPRHLLKNSEQPEISMLCDDPAAVMEAILLEETDEDEVNDYNDKISPDIRQFTLEDLFNQGDDREDESLVQSGRSRGRIRQKTATVITHLPQLTPKSVAFPERQYSLPNCTSAQGNTSATYPFNFVLQNDSNHKGYMYSSLANGNANPFAAHQTAVLAKALAAHMPSIRLPNPVADMNSQLSRDLNDSEHETSVAATSNDGNIQSNRILIDYDTSHQSDLSCGVKKSKRKGAQPIRHSESIDDAYSSDVYENSIEMDYPTSNHEPTSFNLLPQQTKPQQSHVNIATSYRNEDTALSQPSHIIDSSLQASHM